MWMPLIQARLQERFGERVDFMQLGMFGGRQNKVLLFGFRPNDRRPCVVCRVSRSESGIRSLRREAAERTMALERMSASDRPLVPWFEVGELPDGCFLVEPYIEGRRPKPVKTLDALNAYGITTTRWLKAFRQATTAPSCPSDFIAERVNRRLERIIRALEGTPHAAWLEAARPHVERLRGHSPCAVHGDFWRGNVRFDEEDLRVFDWEFTEGLGNPFFDVLLNLITLTQDLSFHDRAAWFERAFMRPTPYARLIGALLRYFDPDPAAGGAMAVSVLHVLVELVLRDMEDGVEPQESPQFLWLERLGKASDPVQTIESALWSNC